MVSWPRFPKTRFRVWESDVSRQFLVWAIAALAFMPAAIAAPLHPVFKVDPNWPKQMPHGYVFGSSGGVTVDAHDNVWIYSRPWSLRLTTSNPPDDMSGRAAPSVASPVPPSPG